jgi:cis-L-3-hydroxyproline dehydratase
VKITRIDVFQVRYGLVDKSYAWSGGHSVTSFVSNIVKISTDQGVSGFAEVCPLGSAYMEAFAAGVPTGIHELAPALLGKDPLQIRLLNVIMDSVLGGHRYVKAPIDTACWDILGKVSGMSVCQLLGGIYQDDYPLYRAISQRSPSEMAEDVRRYRSEGYTRFQLKVGGNPAEDIMRIMACLEVTGEGDILIADANTGWRPHQALRVLNALAGRDFYVEAPCPTYEECLMIRRNTRLPFILDEVMTGIHPLVRGYNDGAMDCINIKISRVGGITRAVQMRNLCEQLGIVMTIEDSWGGDVTTATIAHLAGSTRPEFLFTSTDFNSYVDLRIAEDAPRRKNGRLAVPKGAGLGITINEQQLGKPVLTMKLP